MGFQEVAKVELMPQFAMFFSVDDGFGIELVQALDAGHAQDIAGTQHPTGWLSAVPAELLDVKDRHKRLVALLRVEGEPGGAAARQQSVQHPDPDTPQQSHWHDRQGKHGKALKLFLVHSPYFLLAAHRTATSCCGRSSCGEGLAMESPAAP